MPFGDQAGLRGASRFQRVSLFSPVPSTLTMKIAAWWSFFTRVKAIFRPLGDHCDSVSKACVVGIAVVSRWALLPSALAMKIP